MDSQKRRKTASSKLRKDLACGKAIWQRRICVHFPNDKNHQNHLVGQAGGISQPVDTRILRKIEELVAEGVNDVYEMRRHIKYLPRIRCLTGTLHQPATVDLHLNSPISETKCTKPLSSIDSVGSIKKMLRRKLRLGHLQRTVIIFFSDLAYTKSQMKTTLMR